MSSTVRTAIHALNTNCGLCHIVAAERDMNDDGVRAFEGSLQPVSAPLPASFILIGDRFGALESLGWLRQLQARLCWAPY